MPTYEYVCKGCGKQHEVFQKITDEPLTVCPSCNKPMLSKQISGGNFQLKGTGWYVTDIRDKGKKKPSETPESSKSEKKAESTDSAKGGASDVKSGETTKSGTKT